MSETTQNQLNVRILFLTWAVGLMATLFAAMSAGAVPWAFSVQSSISAIQAKIEGVQTPPDWVRDSIKANTAAIHKLEDRLRQLERGPANGNGSQ